MPNEKWFLRLLAHVLVNTSLIVSLSGLLFSKCDRHPVSYYKGVVQPTGRSYTKGGGNKFDSGYCTWYVWGRALELDNISLPFRDDAEKWWNDNRTNKSYPHGRDPEKNSVAVWSGGGHGHVVYVDSVVNNQISFEEANWDTHPPDSDSPGLFEGKKTCSRTDFEGRSGFTFLGYMYLRGPRLTVDGAVSTKRGQREVASLLLTGLTPSAVATIWASRSDGTLVPELYLNSDLQGVVKTPPQQNLWVDSGSGRRPKV